MNYQQYPDRITIEVIETLKVSPNKANFGVKIASSSIVFGDEALKTSKEIRSFVRELTSLGIREDCISVENVFIQSKTRKIFNSSTAEFTIKVTNVEKEKLAEVLNAIAAQKEIELQDIEWIYSELEKKKAALLRRAAQASKQQAHELCHVLGVNLLGVYNLSSKWREPDSSAFNEHEVFRSRMSKSVGRREDEIEGFDLIFNYSDYLQVTVKIDYRVSEFTDAPQVS